MLSWKRVYLVTCLLAISIQNSVFAGEFKRTFSEGAYRQNGVCKQLKYFGTDDSSQCEGFVAVLVRQVDVPEFMFKTSTGQAFFFVAGKPAEYSEGNRVITYPISHVTHLAEKKHYESKGSCVLKIAENQEHIDCEVWRDEDKTIPMFSARFVGDGAWFYKPSSSKKP